jgi:hypothetical protein
MDESMMEFAKELAEKTAPGGKRAKPESNTRISFWNWRMWAMGGAGAVTAVLILVVTGLSISHLSELAHRQQYENRMAARP